MCSFFIIGAIIKLQAFRQMKYYFLFFIFLSSYCVNASEVAFPKQQTLYEEKVVQSITIGVTPSSSAYYNTDDIKNRLQTKEGSYFSQEVFDQDLKNLSENYFRIEPCISIESGGLIITLMLWEKPIIKKIDWVGNKYFSTKKLQKELQISPGSIFDRDEFNTAFNKLKELYIKRGFFESQLSFHVIPNSATNEITIQIHIDEGRCGIVSHLQFIGFTKEESKELMHMINAKRYRLLLSWLTGKGIYNEEATEHDRLIITDYLQNQGYADANVKIEAKPTLDGRVTLSIIANKGKKYTFHTISFCGNTIFQDKEIQKKILIKEGDIFSPEKFRTTLDSLKDLYGEKGYIDANIQYTLELLENQTRYKVSFIIEEGKQYRVGLIKVLGNKKTQVKVILRESLLIPGDIFDIRQLKSTQKVLETTGYFKSVNIYTVQGIHSAHGNCNYRDVIIEIDEASTGNAGIFFTFNRDGLVGGADIQESNFNWKGLTKFWREGPSSLRGAGQYVRTKVAIGQKEKSAFLSWTNPYFYDTYWSFGFNTNYSYSKLQSDDYHITKIGGTLFLSRPISPFFRYGFKYRLNNSIIHIHKKGPEALHEERNSGLTSGFALTLDYDSTDHLIKPRKGLRSSFESEIGGVRRRSSTERVFPFLKFLYNNSYYYSLWDSGTFKLRADLGSLIPFAKNGKPFNVPISERFFAGGENTVRGYAPYCLGPKLDKEIIDPVTGVVTIKKTKDPTGGISSAIFSAEYNQRILPVLDAFVFFDAGSISMKRGNINRIQMSYGAGLRITVGNGLPLTVGMGFPINPTSKSEIQKPFFSMAGQF